ncbi:COQ9 family protein [Aquicoccus sp. G2-2]|uniref:COQ9 family protein n=1 Tax=Aquicoccus sp. G2-2 TaxID=3092120 RepID=UPI002ADF0C56|nr:COQ9 family protein [Aquicoccus sp. G2-2]MEA1114441.1 COQ9 family protein [Aquicoccus sp. G2-2]
MSETKDRLLDAAMGYVAFDGWSEATFKAAMAEADVPEGLARGVCPRGAVDLAIAYHRRGDAQMVARLEGANRGEMRFRDRIAQAVRFRLEVVDDPELVRRGMTLFALPQYAPDGAKLIWETCDLIWRSLGDESDDINWYSKRATLSGVYSATVLYWLGDSSEGHEATWAFLDRRIGDVMRIESAKAKVRENPALMRVLKGPLALLGRVRKPENMNDMPGKWRQ